MLFCYNNFMNENKVDINETKEIIETEIVETKSKINEKPSKAWIAPLWMALVFIFLGYFGLSLVSELTAIILKASKGLTEQEEIRAYFSMPRTLGLLNFIRYIVIFAIMVGILEISKQLVPLLKGFKKARPWLAGIVYFAIGMGINMIIGSISILIFGPVSDNVNQQIVVEVIKATPVASFIFIPFLGPIVEELTYRVGLYSLLRRWNKIAALVISALIFGFIHFDYSVFSSIGSRDFWIEIINLPKYVSMGLVFGHAYENEGPQTPIIAHVYNNFIAYFATLLS